MQVQVPRQTANRWGCATPRRNLFKEQRANNPALPLTPPETPVTALSSNSNTSPLRLGSYVFPLHDPSMTSHMEYTYECSRQAVETHRDAREHLRVAEELHRMKEGQSGDIALLHKEFTKAIAVERQAKEDLQNELAAERQVKKNLENELATHRQAKANLQSELALEQKSTKTLQENLATVQQEKADFGKVRTKEASEYSSKLDKLQKEGKLLSEKLHAERRKTHDLEKSNIRLQEQLQQSEKEKAEIRQQTINECETRVLKALVHILAEDSGIASLTAENIAPSLHTTILSAVNGTITWKQLTQQVCIYYEQHPEECGHFLGSAATAGTQDFTSPGPQPQTSSWQQTQQAYAPASEAHGFENEPDEMEIEPTHATTEAPVLLNQPQGSFEDSSWMQSSAEYDMPDSMVIEATDQRPPYTDERPPYTDQRPTHTDQRPPCKFVLTPRGCKLGEACKFSHAAADVGFTDVTTGPMVVETTDQRRACKYALRPDGCKWGKACKFTHPAEPSALQQSPTGPDADIAGPVVVQTPLQRPICKFMLYPGGCKQRGTCNSSHPGDQDCGIASEAVSILTQDVIPAKRELSQAKGGQARSDAQGQLIRAYYKFIVAVIRSARKASLNLNNRTRFLEMIDYHISGEVLTQLIDQAKPDLLRRLNLPSNGFLNAATSIDEWFADEHRMSEEAQRPWAVLKAFDEIINDKLNL